jgi:hypothetical protein
VAPSGEGARAKCDFGVKRLHNEIRPGQYRADDDTSFAVVINQAALSKREKKAPSGVHGAWQLKTLDPKQRFIAGCGGSRCSPISRRLADLRKPDDGCKNSTDPFIVKKAWAIISFLLDQPANEMVLFQRTQSQSMDRT